MKTKPAKMPKGYTVTWTVFAAAYAIWMGFFMNGIVLKNYETVPERAVDGILHSDITGMIGRHWLYPVWAVVSTVCLLLFIFYIKKLLFSGKNTKADKIFCLVSLVFGCAFITWYGFFKNPNDFTASMIGLDYPWHFRMWGVFSSMAVFCNTLYMYNRYNYYSRLGLITGSIGSAAIFITINVPSAGEDLHLDSLRCMSHWTGALVFAFFCAAPMVIMLFSKAKNKNKRFLVMFVCFAAVLLTMLILLITVGKSGLIENLPMWAAYTVLFLANFTNIFEKEKQ